jgi:hypothetical protein
MTAAVLTAGKRYLGIVVAGQMPEFVAYRVWQVYCQSFERNELERELVVNLNAV